MFGSVANILELQVSPNRSSDYEKVSPKALFQLVQALDKDLVDKLDMLKLVEGERPLTALVRISE